MADLENSSIETLIGFIQQYSWNGSTDPDPVLRRQVDAFAARVRAEAVADERQRIAALIEAKLFPDDYDDWCDNIEGWNRALAAVLKELAAGSVPVATLPTCEHGRTASHSYPSRRRWTGGFEVCPGPVATPTEPAERHACPADALCHDRHHAGYGQLCTVVGCTEDWCQGSHQGAAPPVPAEQPEGR